MVSVRLARLPKAVGKVGVVALHQRVEGKRAVLPEDDFAQQEIAQRIRAQHVEDGFRAHDVAARLRHLALFKQQPAVRHDRLGQRQARSHQERRPVHAVEADNLLADHVHIGRPVFLEASCASACDEPYPMRGDVVGQRIQPDVDHMLGIVGHRNAPGERAAADGKIAQPARTNEITSLRRVSGRMKSGCCA